MKNKRPRSCRILIYLFPGVKYFESTINSDIYIKALSLLSNLNFRYTNITDINLKFSKIILVDKNGDKLFILPDNIVIKVNNTIELFTDPELKLQTYIINQIADKFYDEVKYFLEVENER
jgi:hypothetical protein